MTKLIAMDVDGVVAALDTNWMAWYNRIYNDNVQASDITDWDVHKFVKPECGHKIYEFLKNPSLYDDVLPYPGASSSIAILKSQGHRIVYATTSPIESFGRKFLWLKQYGFITDLKDYFETNDKSLVRADILVDDRPKNLETFVGKKVLYAQKWNATEKWNINYLYAESWEDVIRYCNE